MRAVRLAVAGLALALCACGRQGPGVRVYVPVVPEALDPYRDHRFGPLTAYASVFESLALGHDEAAPRPGLARAWSLPQPDTCLIQLQTGLRFHDGSLLDAGDVVRSFEQARSHDLFVARQLSAVTSIEAVDAHTVRLRSRQPFTNLNYLLIGVPITRPGPRGLLGTGPYRAVKLQPGRQLTVERFPGYHGPPSHVATAEFRPFAPAEAVQRLSADPWALMVDPPRPAVEWARASSTHVVAAQTSSALAYLAFGQQPGLETRFRDRRVRQAVHLALDRPELVRVGSLLGTGASASQLVPPGVFGYDPSLPEPARDLERARALLAEAGLQAGFDDELEASTTYEAAAREVAAQLAPVGIRLRVRVWPSGEFSQRVERQQVRNFVYSWVLGLQSGEALSSFLRTRDEGRAVGLRNRTGYGNPEVDAEVDAALDTRLPAERLPHLQRAMRLLMTDLPWVPLFVPDSARIHPRELRFAPSTDPFLRLQQAEPAR